MKAINIVVIALAVLACLAAGAYGLALALDPGLATQGRDLALAAQSALAEAGPFRPLLGLGSALLLAAGVGVVWGNISMRRWERLVVLRNPLGEVMVSLTALEDLGRLVKADVPGVKDIKLRVAATRRGLRADARVTLQGDVDLPAVTEAVQAAIRRRLQRVVGEDQDIRPRVMVSKVMMRDAAEMDDLMQARPRLRRPPRP